MISYQPYYVVYYCTVWWHVLKHFGLIEKELHIPSLPHFYILQSYLALLQNGQAVQQKLQMITSLIEMCIVHSLVTGTIFVTMCDNAFILCGYIVCQCYLNCA